MTDLNIPKTTTTPEVKLDSKNNFFSLSGESRPENAKEFYGNVINWFNEYKSTLYYIVNEGNKPKKIQVIFDFAFLSSISTKYIYEVLKALESLREYVDITIKWVYHEEDIDMEQNGQEYSTMVDLPFEFEFKK